MVTKDLGNRFVGPGTAGIAQRISSTEEYKIEEGEENKLSILAYNKIMPCSQNQY